MKSLFPFLLALNPLVIFAQDITDSTSIQLQPVEVKLYFSKQNIMKLTGSTHHINQTAIQQSNTSLVNVMNTVPGLRMEERSPGSYRLAIRGSMIRSPFGVRNTKIYIDEFPLTDAGGNTYFNLLAPTSLQSIQVIKGPDGSLFGANSGGVIQLTPNGFGEINDGLGVQLSGGSYGLFQQNISLQKVINPQYQFSIDQSFQRADGYRNHSALNKKTFQTAHEFHYTPKNTLKLFALYSDMGYETPGGLTLAQFEDNPQASRPAAGPNPSAEDQKAAIYNKTFFGGLSHQFQVSDNLQHHISLFGSHTDFENPFITNYEFRKESNLGLRTYLSWTNKKLSIPLEMQFGWEGIYGDNKIKNYDNLKGEVGDIQASDVLSNYQWNLFYRAQASLLPNWTIEGSLGLNKFGIDYGQNYPIIENPSGEIRFKPILMPRIATSYLISSQLAVRASLAKGYSTPTIAEVRSSDNVINKDLQAEDGINYEIGYKVKSKNNRLIWDASAYQYNMNNGIVRHLRENGAEYYNNAGQIIQKGLESSLWYFLPITNTVIKDLSIQSSVSYNHYRFGEYNVAGNDFENNKVTAVPDWIWTNSLNIHFKEDILLNLNHNFTSSLPLDDTNTIFTDKYHLLQAKASWLKKIGKSKFEFFIAADNILDEKYSLGNDINAFGGRYFNAAASRNYMAGIKWKR